MAEDTPLTSLTASEWKDGPLFLSRYLVRSLKRVNLSFA
jgi:hypothetical protein